MKNQSIKISLVQSDLVWENTTKNLENFDKLLTEIDNETEIIILPEMFSTGFTMNVENLEKPLGKRAFDWLKDKAKKLDKIIVGSILFEQDEKYYNRMFWMRPDGSFETYDKRHLFSMANEHKIITAGNKRTIVEYKGIKFLLQICYDLRFPVWSKNTYDKKNDTYEFDTIIYIANWPEKRKQAYTNLLKARAIENQSYIIWVNRIGKDNQGIYHSGDTQIIDSFGNILKQAEKGKNKVVNTEISIEKLKKHRLSFKVGMDWDKFSINI